MFKGLDLFPIHGFGHPLLALRLTMTHLSIRIVAAATNDSKRAKTLLHSCRSFSDGLVSCSGGSQVKLDLGNVLRDVLERVFDVHIALSKALRGLDQRKLWLI